MEIFLVWGICGLCCLIILILAYIAVIHKKANLCWAIMAVVVGGMVLCCWLISENALKSCQPVQDCSSLQARIDAFISGVRDGSALETYNPCDHNGFDGPIGSQEIEAFSSFYFTDFILIVDKNSDLILESLTSSEFPDSLFSLPRAGYAIRNQFLNRALETGHRWMIQLLETTKIDDELAFVFVAGEGKDDYQCSRYFKVQSKYAISLTGRVYKSVGNAFVFIAQTSDKEIPELTADRECGVNILTLL